LRFIYGDNSNLMVEWGGYGWWIGLFIGLIVCVGCGRMVEIVG